jgi:hypothetical protein
MISQIPQRFHKPAPANIVGGGFMKLMVFMRDIGESAPTGIAFDRPKIM